MSDQKSFNKEFLIHESRVDAVVRKLERLSKLAVKLGLPEYHIEVTGDVVQEQPGSNLVDLYKTLSFSGVQPTFSGWRFLAKLEHLDSGSNVIKSWSSDLDNKYKTCPPNCDHCNVNRKRNATFLVANDETGDELQVGSTCVDDFIGGHANPNEMLSLLNGLGEIKWDGDEPFYDPEEGLGSGGGTPYATTLRVLEIACAVIRKDGTYYSQTNLSPGGLSTKDEVAYHLFGKSSKGVVSGPDKVEAKKVLEWLKGDDENTSSYRHNLRVLAHEEAIDARKHLGLMVSAPTAYKRAMDEAKKAQKNAERLAQSNHYIGEAGDKWKAREVVFEGAPYFETQWGTSYNVLMTDVETGASLIWKTSSPLRFLKDQHYYINATVKGHSEYNWQKQTVITRVACPDLAAIEKITNTLSHTDNFEKNLKATLKTISDPNVISSQGMTLLIAASCFTRDDSTRECPEFRAIEGLLKAGADPLQGSHYSDRMKHCLDVAIVLGGGSPLLLEVYLEHLKAQGTDLSTISTILSDSKHEKVTWIDNANGIAEQMVAVAEKHGLPVHVDTYTALRMDVPDTALTGSLTPALAQQDNGYDDDADSYYDPTEDLDDELELNPNVQAPIAPVSEGASLTEQPDPALESEPAPEPEPEPVSMGALVKAYVAATSNTVATAPLDEPDCHEDAPATKKQLGFRF